MIPLKEDNTSALGFINDLINDADFSKLTGKKAPSNKDAYLRGSVSNYAKDLIMTFPCMCDNAIPISTASMISKANERYIITMLEMLFASAQMHGDSGADVIASVHKNLKSNFSVDDYLDALDNYVGESKEPSKVEIAMALREMVNELKKPVQSFPTNSFSESSVFDYELRKRDGNMTIQEASKDIKPEKPIKGSALRGSSAGDYINKLDASPTQTGSGSVTINHYRYTIDDYNDELEAINKKYLKNGWIPFGSVPDYNKEIEALNKKRDAYFDYNDKTKTYEPNKNNIWSSTSGYDTYKGVDIKNAKYTTADLEYMYKQGQITKQEYEKAKELRDIEKHDWERQAQQRAELKDRNDLFQKRLLDSEVKKANELQPSLMIVNFNTMNTDGKIYGTSSFIAGVKSRLISVDSMDIIERIVAKNTTKINFLNFIRATTGEIKFVKDFLLSLDQAKIDAKNASKKGMAAIMWKTLENRSIKNNWNRIKRAGNDASAITVLVISQETVNALMKYHGFDLNKIKNAKFVMDTYNLMGLIICDESVEAAKFLYAGNDNWETQAYSYLEKEGKQATDYKKTINLLNKGVF